MRFINRVEGTFHVAVGSALNTQFREKHWSAAFGSVDQHLNCQPPFGRFTLGFGELPYKVRRIAERSRWRTARQRYRLIEGALPGHERYSTKNIQTAEVRFVPDRVQLEPVGLDKRRFRAPGGFAPNRGKTCLQVGGPIRVRSGGAVSFAGAASYSITSYSNATPSGSFALNHSSAVKANRPTATIGPHK